MTAELVAPALGTLASALSFVLLGLRVGNGSAAGKIDTAIALRLYGRATCLAAMFTRSGYARYIGGLLIASGIVLLALHASLVPLALVALTQAVSQSAVTILKPVFGRKRPVRWRFRQEAGLSFPSGHSTTAVVLYGMSAYFSAFAWTEPAAIKDLIVAVLVLWMIGIWWSRVALGAHYPSDVLGGALIGLAFALPGIVLMQRL